MVIGFGSTERQVERDIFDAAKAVAIEAWKDSRTNDDHNPIVGDGMAAAVRAYLSGLSQDMQSKSDQYKTAATFPDRYSTFYATVLHDASYIAVILEMLHTNRRHALSPDGWACMTNRITECVFSTSDMI